MKNAEMNTFLIDSYFALLKNLNQEARIDLIARLSNSLLTSNKKNNKDFFSLFGSYSSKKTADQIIQDLQDSRSFNRQVEEL